MEKKIESEIRRLVLEIMLIIVFVIVTIPLKDYVSTSAEVVSHYSNIEDGSIVVTNKTKGIYSTNFEEAIKEYRTVMITSYEEEKKDYSLYLVLDLDDNYENIYLSNGLENFKLSDLLVESSDALYFKVNTDNINSKETKSFYYYIWSKDLKETNNIKLKFVTI